MGVRRFYTLAVVVAGVLLPLHGIGWIGALDAGSWPSALAGLALGALFADLVSGAVHWACDTWGDESTPYLGDELIRAFREHHRSPRALLRNDFVDANGASAAPAAALLVGMVAGYGALSSRPGLYTFLWSACLFGALANQFHRWAHMPSPPRGIRWLQRLGLALSPAHHARHHRRPHTVAYCTVTGWSNGILDTLGVWRGLERCVSAATGARPRLTGMELHRT